MANGATADWGEDTGYVGENLGGISAAAQGVPFLNLVMGPFFQSLEAQARQQRLRDMMTEFNNLKMPMYDTSGWTPTINNAELYDNPLLAMAERIQIDPALRQNQMAALNDMRDMGQGYGAAEAEAGRRQAIFEANQMAKARADAAAQQADMRGVGNSGLSMALQAQSGQSAANRAMQGALMAAAQGQQQKMAANQAYQQGLGNLRGQDTDLAARNAAIGNQFNMYNTELQNKRNFANTDIRNRNALNEQTLKNQARQFNLQRGDSIQDKLFNAALQKLAGKYGVTKDMVGLSERQTQRDVEKGKQYEDEWNDIFSMAAGGGGGAGGGGAGMGYMPMNASMGSSMPNFSGMSQGDFDKWLMSARR